MIKKINFSVKNNIDKIISADIRYPEASGQYPAVFIFHGFKGFKDWGFFPYLSEQLTAAGAITICLNFSLNGMAESTDLVSSIDDFANNTVSQQLIDAETIINSFTKGKDEVFAEIKKIWNNEIYILGHSLGGGVAILVANQLKEVQKIALWASVGVFDRYTPRQKEIWRQQGIMEFTNQRTQQVLKLNVIFLEDLEKNKIEYDLNEAISSLTIPVFFVHGREDLTITVKEVEKLAEASNKDNTDFHLIKSTGHTFGAEHPFKATTPALENAISKTIDFFGLK